MFANPRLHAHSSSSGIQDSLTKNLFANTTPKMIKLGGGAVTTMIGGMVSEATGGKFQDGALTAMVIYLYNETASIGISGPGGAGAGGTGEVDIAVASQKRVSPMIMTA